MVWRGRGGLAWQAWRLGTLKLTGWCVAAIVAGAVVWRGMQAALGDSMAGTCRWVAGWTLRWGLYSWRVAAIVAGWTPRWFVCRGRCGACGLYSCCVAAMIAGDAAGCRGGLVWQVWHLGTLKLVPCRDCRRDAAGRRLVSDWFQSSFRLVSDRFQTGFRVSDGFQNCSKLVLDWFQRVSNWFQRVSEGFKLVSDWFQIGFQTWLFQTGFSLVSNSFRTGFKMVSNWFQTGFKMVSDGFHTEVTLV